MRPVFAPIGRLYHFRLFSHLLYGFFESFGVSSGLDFALLMNDALGRSGDAPCATVHTGEVEVLRSKEVGLDLKGEGGATTFTGDGLGRASGACVVRHV